MILPEIFCERMKDLLGEEYDDFAGQYEKEGYRGLRVNLLKCSPGWFERHFPFSLKKIPFAEEGFYIGREKVGRHPWHHAGLFYLQEPSAMSAVAAMDPRPGMKILDLCAAPGGKSTQIAARMEGRGILFSNEVVYSRAKILVSNLERLGVRNAVVTSCDPETLCSRFSGCFDCVLVDAPCSGEGMFRKEPQAVSGWNPDLPAACARRQSAVLESAKKAVAAGGLLVYSTCTFSTEENERVIDGFLDRNPDFEIEPILAAFGREALPEKAGADLRLKKARRIFPRDGGEGHFVARLRKRASGEKNRPASFHADADRKGAEIFREFYARQFSGPLYGTLHIRKDEAYILPEGLPELGGLSVLRAGVPAGKIVSGRFEPSHALYMAADRKEAIRFADFPLESEELARFLHGEEVDAPAGLAPGYAAVMAQGFITGFAKCAGGRLKNHYPKGLRNF